MTRPSTTTTVPEATRLRPSPGIELSPDMLGVLQRRAADLEVTVGALEGDMTTTHTSKRYPLVFLIFNLLTQDDQIRGFEKAAHHLDPEGVFLIETAVPSAWTSAY